MENDKFMLITIFLIVLSGVVCTAAVYATVNDSSSEINGSDNSSSVLENQTDNLTINNTTVENNTNISENGSATNVTTITVTMKPSVDTGLDYKSYTRTWVNYCPFCHKFGTLSDTPKDTSRSNTVPEGEITCDMAKGGCDADFDGVSGKDKLWRDVYLTPADGFQIVTFDNGSTALVNNGSTQKQNIRNAHISILNQLNAE